MLRRSKVEVGRVPMRLTIALVTGAIFGAGCPEPSEPLELRDMSIEPGHARAGSRLTIEVVTFGYVSENPTVTVAGRAAEPVGLVHSAGDVVQLVYHYEVSGDEPEESVPVVAIAQDAEGAELRIEGTVRLDFTSPTVTGLTGPPDPSSGASPTFAFGCFDQGSGNECRFSCSLAGADFGPLGANEDCQSPVTYGELADDEYTFSVFATDLAGNESEAATTRQEGFLVSSKRSGRPCGRHP